MKLKQNVKADQHQTNLVRQELFQLSYRRFYLILQLLLSCPLHQRYVHCLSASVKH